MGVDEGREGLSLRERDGLALLTIDRPDRRNALSRALLGALASTLASLESEPLRAVVLQGAAGCFSAGADLGELDGSLADLATDDAVAGAAGAIRDLPVPVIAAIEGPCVGAAVELAMACDLRVVSETAFFQLPSVRLGILYRPGAVLELSKQLSPAVLSRLLLFGDRLGAPEAVALGLAAAPVAPAAGARTRACELAHLLPDPPSAAARATKRLLVELSRGNDVSHFEDTRRVLASSSERDVALRTARRRVSGRER